MALEKVWEVEAEVKAAVLELEGPGEGAWVVEHMMAVGVLVVSVMVEAVVEVLAHMMAVLESVVSEAMEAVVEVMAHTLVVLVMVPVVLVWDQEDGGLVVDAEDQMERR